jgi:hypothetical protein
MTVLDLYNKLGKLKHKKASEVIVFPDKEYGQYYFLQSQYEEEIIDIEFIDAIGKYVIKTKRINQ